MSSGIEHALARTLLHFLWEGSGVAAVLAAVLWVGRKASAQARYALACAAMVAMAAAFAGTLAWFWPHAHVVTGTPMPSGFVMGAPMAYLRSELPQATHTIRPEAWAVPLWMLGVMLFSARSLAAWLAAVRLRRKAVHVAPAEWQRRFEALVGKARVSRPVRLLESYLTEIPVVIGSLKPVILVPASLFTGFPAEHLELILLHELAHIRRHDYLVNLLQSIAEDVLFYHPAVWWVSSVIRTERENCCDDAVVRARGDARGFAEALAALEERRWSVYEAALAANGGHLMNRIRRLLNAGTEGPRWIAGPLFAAGVALAAAALLAPIGRAQKTPEAPAVTAPVAAPAATAPAAPQESKDGAPASKKDGEERLKKELETPYDMWLNEEVYWIITPDERTAFQKLNTDEEREAFIENFWLKRDPTPGTPENEYEEEHYRRVAYANENFSSGIPGWKTDRGSIYIKYGPPDEREEHPSGGTYERPIEEGGGETATYPFEKWRYRYLPGVGDDVTLEFVDTTLNGDYRMTADPATKDALLYVPGAGLTLAEQLGLAQKSDRFTRTDGTRLGTGTMPLPASMDQFTRLEQFAKLQKPPRPNVPAEDAVESIVFTGARRTPQDLLLYLIPTRAGDKLDQDALDRDAKLLRDTERFDDVQVRYARGKTGWVVTFTVVERLVPAPK